MKSKQEEIILKNTFLIFRKTRIFFATMTKVLLFHRGSAFSSTSEKHSIDIFMQKIKLVVLHKLCYQKSGTTTMMSTFTFPHNETLDTKTTIHNLLTLRAEVFWGFCFIAPIKKADWLKGSVSFLHKFSFSVWYLGIRKPLRKMGSFQLDCRKKTFLKTLMDFLNRRDFIETFETFLIFWVGFAFSSATAKFPN